MKRIGLFLAGAAVLSLVATPKANAVLLAYEGFNYATGTLSGQNDGTGWAGAWSSNDAAGTVQVAGLTKPNITTTGNRFRTDGDNQGIFRTLGAARNTAGTTTWGSFLMRVDGTLNDYAGLSLFTGTGSERFFIGRLFGNPIQYGVEAAGIQDRTIRSSTAVDATTRLLVFSLTSIGADTTVSLYIDPATGGAAPTTADATTFRPNFVFDTIRIQAGQSGLARYGFDEVRFGTTFADVTPGAVVVVPEAGSLALILPALGVLGAVIVRRRNAA